LAAGGDGSGGGAAKRGVRLRKRGFVDAADVYREEWDVGEPMDLGKTDCSRPI
jgi:hypothetical protein